MQTAILSFKAVSFRVRERLVLQNVSFDLVQQGCTALLGHNGAGKTLSLMLAHGLLQPAEGCICWSSEVVATQERVLVLHNPVLLRRSVLANVMYPLLLRGVSRNQSRKRARQALEHARLMHLIDAPARSCSAGEKQRIALTRAWVCRPRILLLDEPTANLDPAAVQHIETMLQQIIGEGSRVLLATHDWSQAQRLASDVLLLKQGRLIRHQSAEQFFVQSPRSC